VSVWRRLFTDEVERETYEVEIVDGKVTVYSECCCDTMSDETAHALYAELHKMYGDG